ncbi:hypothetical protein D3C81_1620710 [compost metagenome]
MPRHKAQIQSGYRFAVAFPGRVHIRKIKPFIAEMGQYFTPDKRVHRLDPAKGEIRYPVGVVYFCKHAEQLFTVIRSKVPEVF